MAAFKLCKQLMLIFQGEISMALFFIIARTYDQHDDFCVNDGIFFNLDRHQASNKYEDHQIFNMLKNTSLALIISLDIPHGWTIIGPYST